jgi:GNAT superfamily N-acetyltransferase
MQKFWEGGRVVLYLADKLHKLNFSQLMEVYAEGNEENGEEMWPELPREQRLLRAEQAFYQYLVEGFFPVPGAVYALWVENGIYISALRLEPYEDGLLLEALETAPQYRRRGCGEKLIRAVQEAFPQRIYSHVGKKNVPSLAIHKKCGFCQVLDYAKYIDGSVARNAVTLRYR